MKASSEPVQHSPRSSGLGAWLLGVSILGGVLVVGLWQVPQPWRGYVIGFITVALIPSLVLMRFMSHWFRWKEARLMARMQGRDESVAYTQMREPGRGDGLKLRVVKIGTDRKEGKYKL